MMVEDKNANNDRDMDKFLQDGAFMQFVSNVVGKDWKQLSRQLKLDDHEIDNIDENYKKVQEKSYQALRKWKEDHILPTLKQLLDALASVKPIVLNALKDKYSIQSDSFSYGSSEKNERNNENEGNNSMAVETKQVEDKYTFDAREREYVKLVEYCRPENSARLIVLAGLPGSGRTELLKAVKGRLQNSYRNCRIIDPNLTSKCNTLSNIVKEILLWFKKEDNCKFKTKNCSPEKLIGILIDGKRTCILILDLPSLVLEDLFWEDLWGFVFKVLDGNQHCKILVITSHLSNSSTCSLAERKDTNMILLHDLNKESSIKLLRMKVPHLNSKTAELIFNYYGGNLLLLKRIISELKKTTLLRISSVVGDTPRASLQGLIRDCTSNEFFKDLFNSMDSCSKLVLVKLSVISGPFDDILLKVIVGEKGTIALTTLKERYLLVEEVGNDHYLQRAFKDFLENNIIAEEKYSSEYNDALEKYIHLNIDLLYSLNDVFLTTFLATHRCYASSVIGTECATVQTSFSSYHLYKERSCRCGCVHANTAAKVFSKNRLHITFCLWKGLEIEKLKGLVINCITKTMPILMKMLAYEDQSLLLQCAHKAAQESNDSLLMAYIVVARTFSKMVNEGIGASQDMKTLLVSAREILESQRHIIKRNGKLEVLAACYCMLGRFNIQFAQSDVSKYIDNTESIDLIKNGVEILKYEIRGEGNQLLEIASCIQLASAWLDIKENHRAIEVLKKHGVEFFHENVMFHPIAVSTFQLIARIYKKLNNYKKAKLYMLLAYGINQRLEKFHFEKVKVYRHFAAIHCLEGNHFNAKNYLKASIQEARENNSFHACANIEDAFPTMCKELRDEDEEIRKYLDDVKDGMSTSTSPDEYRFRIPHESTNVTEKTDMMRIVITGLVFVSSVVLICLLLLA